MNTMANVERVGARQNMELAESVAKLQFSLRRKYRMISVSLVTLTYVLLLIGYLLFLQGYVMKEINFFNLETWMNLNSWQRSYMYLMGLIYVLFTYFCVKKGLFSFHERISLADDFFKLLQSVVFSFLIAVGILFLLKTSAVFSRIFIVGYAGYMFAVACIVRFVGLLMVRELQKRNQLIKNVLIIGAGKIGHDIEKFLTRKRHTGCRVIGFLDDQKKNDRVLGNLQRLESVLKQYDVHEVYITIPSERNVIQELLGKLKKYDFTIKIIPEMYDISATALQFRSSELYPFVEVVKTPLRGFNLFLKRLFDVIFSGIGLILLLPVFAVVAVLIKMDSSGPVFFKQKRIGKNGVPFTMYKFRSMVVNAEELKKDLMPNAMDGPAFKMKEDPRVTKLGKFLRKYSIDELPQLLNVFLGHMSLIGPRPPVPDEAERYSDYEWRRLDVRPGMTGLWQVSGRSDVPFEERVSLDIYYIENWSFALDLKILLRTIPVVLFGKGAY